MISRRTFIQGSGAMLTLAGTGISVGFSRRALAAPVTDNCLVLLFFRGGMDALNFLVPRTGVNRSEYEAKRPNIRIPTNRLLNLDNAFGLPETCGELKQLWNSNDLALVHSVGMPDGQGSRSHFDSQSMFDKGTPGQTGGESGWLARHLQSNPALPGNPIISSMATGNAPESLGGAANLMSIDNADTASFHPNAGRYAEEHMTALQGMFTGGTSLDQAMNGALDNILILSELNLEIPGFYPTTGLGRDLGLIAQIIKADLGLHVAAVDFGGWDDHRDMGNEGTGDFVERLGVVSDAVGAFFQDLENAGRKNRAMLASLTDFGRRVRENGNRGTDHGSGQVMMLAGGNVNGGQIYGHFPGIRNEDLYFNADLRPTMDFRQPLADVVRNHLGNPNVDVVFPGYNGGIDLGLVQRGVPVSGESFFKANFE